MHPMLLCHHNCVRSDLGVCRDVEEKMVVDAWPEVDKEIEQHGEDSIAGGCVCMSPRPGLVR